MVWNFPETFYLVIDFWLGREAAEVLHSSMGQSYHRCLWAEGKATDGLCIAQTQLPACAPAQDTFQLNIAETQGSTNQKSFIKTVWNEKLTFAQRNS